MRRRSGPVTVLFVASFDSYFATMIQLASRLNATDGMHPVMLFHNPYPNLDRDVARCRSHGIEAIFILGARCTSMSRWRGRLSWLLRRLPGVAWVGALARAVSTTSEARAVLRDHRVNVLACGGDIVGHDMCYFIKAARSIGTASVLLPNWMASPREAAEALYPLRTHHLGAVRAFLYERFLPRWVYRHKGETLLRRPLPEILILKAMGVAPPSPWVLHSGYADVIAVESEAARQYGIREGLDAERFRVVGSVVHDMMAEVDNHDRPGDGAPFVLVALPPDMLDGVGRPGCEFDSYEALVRCWMDAVTQCGAEKIVISLHPSTRRETIEPLIPKTVEISAEPVQNLLPHCAFYVSSISATIQWAIVCGKPVVNYDVYRYRYTDYDGVPGVVLTETKGDFQEQCTRMATDGTYLAELATAQRRIAADWGVLDGSAVHRTVALFRQVAGYHRSALTPMCDGRLKS